MSRLILLAGLLLASGCDTLDPGNASSRPWSQNRNPDSHTDSFSRDPANDFR